MVSTAELLERVIPISNPETLLQVSRLASEPEANVREVVSLVERDQGLATLLLRLANNSANPTLDLAIDVPRAVGRLGLQVVATMAASAVGLRILRLAPRDGVTAAREQLHLHGVNTGVTARLLARTVDREEALAVGLLHNVGLFAMSVAVPWAFRELLELLKQDVSFAQAEAEIFEISHAEFGALLADGWGLPAPLVTAIREHEDEAPASPLACTVRVADLMMRESGYGVQPPEPIHEELLEVGYARSFELLADDEPQSLVRLLTSGS
jgi:HD-like signal output (HDOD) protein